MIKMNNPAVTDDTINTQIYQIALFPFSFLSILEGDLKRKLWKLNFLAQIKTFKAYKIYNLH